MSRYPMAPFPTGWFPLQESGALPAGQAVPVTAFGQELVLFRTESGVATVLDAWCPHLGAHLGRAGAVKGEEIVCPFHRWQFGQDGRCTHIPYSDKPIPRRAAVQPWPVVERNGWIFAWHDAAGGAPTWDLPEVGTWDHPDWTAPLTIRRECRFHVQEIRENGVDAYHFLTVHGMNAQEMTTSKDGPVFTQRSGLDLAHLGAAALTVDFHGLGYALAHQRIGDVEIRVFSHTLPVAEEHTRLSFAVQVQRLPSLAAVRGLLAFMKQAEGDIGDHGNIPVADSRPFRDMLRWGDAARSVGRAATGGPAALMRDVLTQIIAPSIAAELARQLDQDIYITEHKSYLDRPLLREGEGPIMQMRRWAKQFYPAEAAQAAK